MGFPLVVAAEETVDSRQFVADVSVRRLDVGAGRSASGRVPMEAVILQAKPLATGFDKSGNLSFWNVTRQTLRQIADSFATRKLRGLLCPVQWGHSNDPRDTCGEVESLRIAGDELIAQFSLSEESAADHVVSHKLGVSVETKEPWRDGDGNVYPIALTHLGIVHSPVVKDSKVRRLSVMLSEGEQADRSPVVKEGGRKPMKLFGIEWYARKIEKRDGQTIVTKRQLAEGDTIGDGEELVPATSADAVPGDRVGMAVEFVKIVAQLLGMEDLSLGSDVSEDNLDERMKALLPILRAFAAKALAAKGGMPSDPMDAPEETIQALSLTDAREALVTIRRTAEADRQKARQSVKATFQTRLLSLAQEGKVTREQFETIRQCGESIDSQETLEAILAPYAKAAPGVNVSNQSAGVKGGRSNGNPARMTTKELDAAW